MKTKEELSILKAEYETLTAKMRELDDAELSEVTGGAPLLAELQTQLCSDRFELITPLGKQASSLDKKSE